MYNALLDRIMPVTRRFRARRMWWIVTLIAVIVSLLALSTISSARSGEINGTIAAGAFGGAAALGLIIAWIASRRMYRDPRPVATKIEEKFPDLNQRLLTALSQSETKDGKPLGYLQTRVIREARDHSRGNTWTDAMPASQLWLSRLFGFGSVAALVSIITTLAFAKPSSNSQGVANLPEQPLIEVLVEPGNTEIERGTSLAITARFAEDVPSEAQLICTSVGPDGEETVRRISMRQNLDDPIVGGFIASVDQEFSYQVVTEDWSSESFTVDVFDFPSLVRSDADLDYPEYTGLEDKLIEDTVRVSAVEGTKVKWLCFLNKPVTSGELVDKDGNRIELQADPTVPGALFTEFDLNETRRLTLELIDDAGRKNKYPPELVARVLPNKPPKLKLTNAKDSSVSPLEELPIGVEVRDDFGIAQVGLTYKFGDEPIQSIVLKENIGRSSKQTINHLIAMEDLNAEPDQLLAYHFWAEDRGPDGELRRTESDMFFAEVRPFEEIFREGEPPPGGQQQQQQQQQQNANGQKAEELAELQKQIINATWTVIRGERNPDPSEKFVENVNLLKSSQADALSQLEELAGELNDAESQTHAETVREKMERAIAELTKAADGNYTSPLHPALAAEQAAYGGLLKLRAREFQVVRQQQRQQQRGQQSQQQQRRQQQLDDLEIKEEENRYETQQQAQTEQEQQQREVRQVLNRLRELAKRQEDLNKQLAELQSALEQAETEKEKEEIERQLKRLRDQQQDLLRETDELAERMQSPENADEMSESSEQLDQTRENVRKATEALENKDASEALTAGKRAEREFEDMRDEFRKKAAGEFNETVREMRSRAQDLQEQQEKIAEQMKEETSEKASPGLRSDNEKEGVEGELQQQREKLGELLDQMQKTVEDAEAAEPLLAQKLYDSYRKAQQKQIDRRLRDTAELLRRGFDTEAQKFQQPAQEGIAELRKEIEEAAESVLGDETEGLRRALSEMEQLTKDLEREIDEADPNARSSRRGQQDGERNADNAEGQPNPNGQPDPNSQRRPNQEPSDQQQPSGQGGPSDGEPQEGQQPNEDRPQGDGQEGNRPNDQQQRNGEGQQPQDGEQPPGERPSGQQPNGQPSQQQGQRNGQQGQPNGQGNQPNENGDGEPQQDQSGQNPQQSGRPSQNGQPQDTEQRRASAGEQNNGGLSRFAADNPSSRPIAGDGFRDWSDRLRDVEEMVEDPELRSRAARIRDRARDVRIDLKRHSKDPQWALVDEMIAQPLRELKRDVQEELMRRSAEKNALVPIDRDPVPDEFTDAVQRYYENLGSGR